MPLNVFSESSADLKRETRVVEWPKRLMPDAPVFAVRQATPSRRHSGKSWLPVLRCKRHLDGEGDWLAIGYLCSHLHWGPLGASGP